MEVEWCDSETCERCLSPDVPTSNNSKLSQLQTIKCPKILFISGMTWFYWKNTLSDIAFSDTSTLTALDMQFLLIWISCSTGHSGKHGHEFLEFEFSHGRLRYANNSNYRNDSLIRKESEHRLFLPFWHVINDLCAYVNSVDWSSRYKRTQTYRRS